MIEIVSVAFLTVLASGVGTLTGFGTSTILVPALLIIFPLPKTLLLVGVIHWFGNVWKVWLFRSSLQWKILLAFGVPGIAASIAGASLVIRAPQTRMTNIMGFFLVGYALFLILKPNFKLRQNILIASSGGALSGFMAGIFGIGGAVRSAFLSLFDLPREIYIFTAGAIALAIDSARLATYWAEGARLETLLLGGLLLFVPASFLGAKIAQRLAAGIPQKRFRPIVMAFLFLVGIRLLLVS